VYQRGRHTHFLFKEVYGGRGEVSGGGRYTQFCEEKLGRGEEFVYENREIVYSGGIGAAMAGGWV
jgi:hypothetical protein